MRAYTKSQYYLKERTYRGKSIGYGVFRNNNCITTFKNYYEAEEHVRNLNKRFGDTQAYKLLNNIRDEITLYEDGEYSAERIVESIKAMLDSREIS